MTDHVEAREKAHKAAMEAANKLRWHYMTAPSDGGDGAEREAEIRVAVDAALRVAAEPDEGVVKHVESVLRGETNWHGNRIARIAKAVVVAAGVSVDAAPSVAAEGEREVDSYFKNLGRAVRDYDTPEARAQREEIMDLLDESEPSVVEPSKARVIYVNRVEHRIENSAIGRDEVVKLAACSDDVHVWLARSGGDLLVTSRELVPVEGGESFYTAPRYINAGADVAEPSNKQTEDALVDALWRHLSYASEANARLAARNLVARVLAAAPVPVEQTDEREPVQLLARIAELEAAVDQSNITEIVQRQRQAEYDAGEYRRKWEAAASVEQTDPDIEGIELGGFGERIGETRPDGRVSDG